MFRNAIPPALMPALIAIAFALSGTALAQGSGVPGNAPGAGSTIESSGGMTMMPMGPEGMSAGQMMGGGMMGMMPMMGGMTGMMPMMDEMPRMMLLCNDMMERTASNDGTGADHQPSPGRTMPN